MLFFPFRIAESRRPCQVARKQWTAAKTTIGCTGRLLWSRLGRARIGLGSYSSLWGSELAGCILAGLGDLSFDPMGYTMAFASCALQTTYLVMVERSGTEKGYNSNELLLYNAVMSLPVLTVLVYITGEGARSLPSLWAHQSSNFLWLLGGSLVMGSLLNYTLFLCTITNSALSTTIVGTLRSVFGTILGFFVLGGVKATPLIILGVTTNTAGGVWYTAVKFRQKYSSKGSDEGSTQFGSSDPKRSPRPVEHSTFSSSLEPKRSQQDP